MKKIILSALLLSVTAIAGAQEPVAIRKQGHFSVGGTTIQRLGTYDNRKFVGWAEQEETGQSYRADHAFVDYQIPADSKLLPLVYVHGYGGSGVCWQMTPDISDHKQDVPALGALAKRIGNHILVTHSAGGFPGWMSAMQNTEVKAVVSYEPGGFVFPEDEVPERIDGLTGGVAGTPVSMEQFKRLTEIPIVLYFGDYIPETPSENLGDENWRVRLQMARKFVEAVNRHGGNATLVELPKIGIYGNTHFLMQDLNNDKLAELLDEWLIKNGLSK